MGKKSEAIDTYIARSAPFARPILRRLRKVVHAGCPAVEETIKWGVPHFEYKGVVAGMAAFKQHAPNARLAYVMTDGAALPGAFSRSVVSPWVWACCSRRWQPTTASIGPSTERCATSWAGQTCAMRTTGGAVTWLIGDHQNTQSVAVTAGTQAIR